MKGNQAGNWMGESKETQGDSDELDVLDLPSRKDVHIPPTTKIMWKLSRMWMHILFILFILMISILFSYQYWNIWFEDTIIEPMIQQKESPYHEKITVELGGTNEAPDTEGLSDK